MSSSSSLPNKRKDDDSHSSRAPAEKKKRSEVNEYDYISLFQAAERVKQDASGTDSYKIGKNDLIYTYGVILSYTLPKELPAGRSSKFMASYFIADPSMPFSVATNVCLNIFADSLAQMPVVHAAGDIIRCHRVKVNYWNGLQLVGTMKDPVSMPATGTYFNHSFFLYH